jgi:hypothetical protein
LDTRQVLPGGMSTRDRQQGLALPKFSRPKYQYWNSLASDRSIRDAVYRSHSRLCPMLAVPYLSAGDYGRGMRVGQSFYNRWRARTARGSIEKKTKRITENL